jgi:hypothetical protein
MRGDIVDSRLDKQLGESPLPYLRTYAQLPTVVLLMMHIQVRRLYEQTARIQYAIRVTGMFAGAIACLSG